MVASPRSEAYFLLKVFRFRQGMDTGETTKSRQVRRMFGEIAHRYDLLNTLLSFGQDRRWRRLAIRMLEIPEKGALLDAAAGTADVALAAARAYPETGLIVVLDFSRPMLELAATKIRQAKKESKIFPVTADVTAVPLPDGHFDAVTIAFGIRNVVDVPAALSEFHRVLKPGGRLLILEFSQPRGRLFGTLFRWYFTRILPRLGGAVSGRRSAYEYLPDSVRKFHTPEELKGLMTEAGFSILGIKSYSLGIVHAYLGLKGYEGKE